jgi:ketosteroid isomerase-like protein
MTRKCHLVIVILLAVTILPTTMSAAPKKDAESEVRETLASFIQAFDNLDWEEFRLSFADDATVFYPREFPRRAKGRREFEGYFQKVFDRIRAGRSQGPYMDIQPRDLALQIAGGVCIVTFHLDDRPGFLNRRTVVLQKQKSGWKIIHLHASEVATPTQ